MAFFKIQEKYNKTDRTKTRIKVKHFWLVYEIKDSKPNIPFHTYSARLFMKSNKPPTKIKELAIGLKTDGMRWKRSTEFKERALHSKVE